LQTIAWEDFFSQKRTYRYLFINIYKFVKDLNAALKELSSAVAATTGKPESYVMVQILPDQVRGSIYFFFWGGGGVG
jgi:Macrophage migration inhibitory factor (MIF)